MKNVYNIEERIYKLTDRRVNPTFKTGKVILPVLFGFLLRIQSFNKVPYLLERQTSLDPLMN